MTETEELGNEREKEKEGVGKRKGWIVRKREFDKSRLKERDREGDWRAGMLLVVKW